MAGIFNDIESLQNIVGTNRSTPQSGPVVKGALISFEYPKSLAVVPNVIHDKRPMLIVTDVRPPYIRGVNLHYLTYPYIKKILETWGGNQSFSYSNIKADKYVASAFRVYSLNGVIRPKRLDTEWLKFVLQTARTFDAGEIEKIRSIIEQQIRSRLQVKANELTAYEKQRKQMEIINNAKFTQNQNILTQGVQPQNIVPTMAPKQVANAPANENTTGQTENL